MSPVTVDIEPSPIKSIRVTAYGGVDEKVMFDMGLGACDIRVWTGAYASGKLGPNDNGSYLAITSAEAREVAAKLMLMADQSDAAYNRT